MNRPLLLAALLLAACRPPQAAEAPLRVDTVGPRAERQLIADAISAGLTARDPAGQVVPGLAQSWRVSDDGLSIVFRLRPARFVGGRPVTAADVVESIQRARQGRAGPATRDLLAGVTAVSAPLDNVVEIRLSTPQPELLELLATPQLSIRARAGRKTAGAYLATRPADGAPPGTPTKLAANPEFHAADTVAIAAAEVQAHAAEVAIRRFNQAQTDLVLGGGLDGFGSARVTVRADRLVIESPRAALLLLVNRRQAALKDPRVRRALALAIDRPALGQGLFGSAAARPVLGLVPGNVAGYTPAEPDWAAQPFVARQEEARRLLAAAGHDPLVKPLTLAVAIADSDAEARLIEAVASDLAAVGVRLTLVRRSPEAHRLAVRGGSFDLALDRRDTPVDSPLPFLWPNLCDRNRHGVCLPEADRLVAESWRAPTRAERMRLLAEAERLWAADGAAIGLVQPLGWSLVGPRLTGFVANPSGSHALRHLARDQRRLLK